MMMIHLKSFICDIYYSLNLARNSYCYLAEEKFVANILKINLDHIPPKMIDRAFISKGIGLPKLCYLSPLINCLLPRRDVNMQVPYHRKGEWDHLQ